jgi:hypothetical protein
MKRELEWSGFMPKQVVDTGNLERERHISQLLEASTAELEGQLTFSTFRNPFLPKLTLDKHQIVYIGIFSKAIVRPLHMVDIAPGLLCPGHCVLLIQAGSPVM